MNSVIQDRAAMLAQARSFFATRGVLEVDCCALQPCAAIDSQIDVIEAAVTPQDVGYLHTSPEYAMKRLLSSGSGDIFYLGHVFRQGEIGRHHSPEFTMAEWYRVGFSFEEMIEETCDFIELVLGKRRRRSLTYRAAFEEYVGIDYSAANLVDAAKKLEPSLNCAAWSQEALRQFILSHAIEPKLGRGELTALTHYPPSEAALACVVEQNGEQVAERFEIYSDGLELANGYHELADADELRRRFTEENATRQAAGKPAYALDEPFLQALAGDFPDCCGVSVGFDRLMLLRHKAKALAEVLPFAFAHSKF